MQPPPDFHVEGALMPLTRALRRQPCDGTDVRFTCNTFSAKGTVARDTGREPIYGAKPFGAGLMTWIQSATGFNLTGSSAVRLESESEGCSGYRFMCPAWPRSAAETNPFDFITPCERTYWQTPGASDSQQGT